MNQRSDTKDFGQTIEETTTSLPKVTTTNKLVVLEEIEAEKKSSTAENSSTHQSSTRSFDETTTDESSTEPTEKPSTEASTSNEFSTSAETSSESDTTDHKVSSNECNLPTTSAEIEYECNLDTNESTEEASSTLTSYSQSTKDTLPVVCILEKDFYELQEQAEKAKSQTQIMPDRISEEYAKSNSFDESVLPRQQDNGFSVDDAERISERKLKDRKSNQAPTFFKPKRFYFQMTAKKDENAGNYVPNEIYKLE